MEENYWIIARLARPKRGVGGSIWDYIRFIPKKRREEFGQRLTQIMENKGIAILSGGEEGDYLSLKLGYPLENANEFVGEATSLLEIYSEENIKLHFDHF